MLHVLAGLNHGGIETWLMQVMRCIDWQAVQFDFLCLSGDAGSMADEARALGARFYPFRLTRNLPAFNRELAALVAANQYDIVHSHVHQFSGYVLWQAARLGVRGRIAHSFTAPPPAGAARRLYGALMRRLVDRYSTLRLGNAEPSMRALFGPAWRQRPDTQLLYCGIELPPISAAGRARVRQRHDIPPAATVIGHLGRLSPPKNHAFFVAVADRLTQQRPDLWFLIAGGGELQAAIAADIAQRGLRNVVLGGRVDHVGDYLAAMDAFLFPSLWEGLPQAVIEAQAAGLRCLCSEAVPQEAVVIADAVQIMPLAAGEAAWAAALRHLLDQPPLDRPAAAAAIAASPFSIASSTAGLLAYYRQEAAR